MPQVLPAPGTRCIDCVDDAKCPAPKCLATVVHDGAPLCDACWGGETCKGHLRASRPAEVIARKQPVMPPARQPHPDAAIPLAKRDIIRSRYARTNDEKRQAIINDDPSISPAKMAMKHDVSSTTIIKVRKDAGIVTDASRKYRAARARKAGKPIPEVREMPLLESGKPMERAEASLVDTGTAYRTPVQRINQQEEAMMKTADKPSPVTTVNFTLTDIEPKEFAEMRRPERGDLRRQLEKTKTAKLKCNSAADAKKLQGRISALRMFHTSLQGDTLYISRKDTK